MQFKDAYGGPMGGRFLVSETPCITGDVTLDRP